MAFHSLLYFHLNAKFFDMNPCSRLLFTLFIVCFGICQAYAQPCIPASSCTYGDGFNSFTFGTINNINSGCNNDIGTGYGDFTALSTTLEEGLTYTATFSTTFENQVISAWIDFNDNDVFESSELIITDFTMASAGTESVDVIIPIGANPGTHLLRIKSNYFDPSSFDACESTYYGETEDYTVEIVASSGCIPSNTIEIVSLSAFEVSLTWNAGEGTSYNWEIVPAGAGQGNSIVDSGTTSTNTASSSALTPLTDYDFYIQDDCGGGSTSSWAGPFSFTTANDYCMTGVFYDNGGPDNSYAPGSDETYIICPNNPGDIVTVIFSFMDLEFGWDFLDVYDGNGTGGTFLGQYSGNTLPPPLVPSDPSGCLTFVFTSDFSGNLAGWEASVTCGPPASCPFPADVTINAITAYTADFSWAAGSETSWNWEIVPAGAGQGSSIVDSGTSSMPMASSTTLNPLTSYDFYVQSECGVDGQSIWIGPINFTTENDFCATGVFYDSGGPTGNYSNGENETTVICPSSAGDIVVVSFSSFNLEQGWDFLNIYDGPDATFPLLGEYTGNTLPPTAVASSPSGCLTFVFTSDFSGEESGWEGIVQCIPAPTCGLPTMLTTVATTSNSVTIDLSPQGPGTEFNAEVGPPGFTLGTGTLITGIAGPPPITITGLLPSSEYDIYIQEVCAPGDLSIFNGPTSAATQCVPATSFPACEDFTNSQIPTCWTEDFDGDWTFSAFPEYGAEEADDHTSGGGTVFAWYDGSNLYSGSSGGYLYTPQYDISSLSAPYISFWMFSYNNDQPGENNTLHLEILDGATWVPVASIINDAPEWVEYQYNLLDYVSGSSLVQCRLYVEGTANTPFFNDILIDDFCVNERFDNDLAVTEILSPSPGSCGLGIESVAIEITNVGSQSQGGFPVYYSVNGSAPINALPDGYVTANIGNLESTNYTFITQYDFSATGTYTIEAWTELSGDEFLMNDTLTFVFENVAPKVLPYSTDFESGSDGWTASNGSSSSSSIWELGPPASGSINSANSGSNAWVTNLTGFYQNNSLTYLTSSCFDMSDLDADPEVSFAIQYNSEQGWDGTHLEVSTDGGDTWAKVGTAADPNWYNDLYDDNFNGNSGGWINVSHALDGAAGFGNVRLRFVFLSDGSTANFDGVGIDDISITDVCSGGFGTSIVVTDETTLNTTFDGQATITLGGGLPPYSYEWSNGDTDDVLSEVPAGQYYVTIMDSRGCMELDTVDINWTCVSGAITGSSIIEESQNSITGDGSITVNANSTPPYTYDWSTGDQTTNSTGTSTLTGLSAGIYTITVTDGTGCPDIITVVLTAVCPVTLGTEVTVTDASVEGTADGSATLNPTFGEGPYIYNWSSGGMSATESGLVDGTYTVTVMDDGGCPEIVTVTVGFTCPTELDVEFTIQDESFVGFADGEAYANTTNGTPPYSYTWDTGVNGPGITDLPAGDYSVTVEDANGCTNVATATVNPGFTTSSDEISSLSHFSLNPNPAMDFVRIEMQFTKNVDVSLSLISSIGQTVMTREYGQISGQNTTLNIEDIPSGVYFIHITVGDQYITKRLIKQ